MKTNPLNQSELKNEIENVYHNLNEALSQFTEKELNTIPFEGSWTAGQVAEHITKSNQGILLQLLNGKAKLTNRPYDEQVEVVQGTFVVKRR